MKKEYKDLNYGEKLLYEKGMRNYVEMTYDYGQKKKKF